MTDIAGLLCSLASLLLLAVGALALLSPHRLSQSYGVAVSERAALAYVRATGARDLVLGSIFAVSVYLQDAHALLTLAAAGLVLAAIDFAIAFTFAGGFRSEQAAHLGGIAGFAAIVVLLVATIHR